MDGKLPLEKGQRGVCAACLSFAGRVDSSLRWLLTDLAEEEDLDGKGKKVPFLRHPGPSPLKHSLLPEMISCHHIPSLVLGAL